VKREWKALTSFGFGLAVLLVALWVGMGPPGTGTRGALGGLLVAGLVAAWELGELVRRWAGVRAASLRAKGQRRREFRQWGLLGASGLGLALLGALGTVPLSFTPALVLLGIASWGLVMIWRAAGSRQG
jgi:hypothetical protein